MKRTSFWAAALVVVAWACANPNAPPGGPDDKDAPVLVKVSPSNNTVGAKQKSVVFQFDEVISETPKGSANLRDLVFISPRSGEPNVSWARSKLEVRPKKGFKVNTVYSITLAAGVSDLYNNVLDSATRIVFSTGGPIPQTRLDGVVFDWAAARGAGRAIVEAVTADSTIYQTIADSAGRYVLEHIPPGPYLLRAFVDRNLNRIPDPLEPFDSVRATFLGTQTTDFYAFSHDTIGLRIADVTFMDTLTMIRLTFDRPPALNQIFTATQFKLQKADSSFLTITNVLTGPQRTQFDSLLRKSREDSANAKLRSDTAAMARARRDSIALKRRQDSTVLNQRTIREAQRLEAARRGRPLPPIDTMPLPKMKQPPLFTDVYLRLEKPLEPAANYRLSAVSVRSISGTVRSPTRTFRTPAKENADSAAKRAKPPADQPVVPVSKPPVPPRNR